MNHTLTILMQNEAGALVRVAGLFAARGYNIDTLMVAATADPSVSRLTLTLQGDDASIAQILQQTRKLVDVLEVHHPARPEAA
ncbi:MAG: acetolactate synthase small subunit [Rhodanobacter sp.]|nr:MAG: acetolactate synthase small subunit [Rhodanobacter sp.]